MKYRDMVARIIKRVKKPRLKKPKKRRTWKERLKARQYYRRHRSKIRLKRKMNYRKNKLYTTARKRLRKTNPSWSGPKK